MSMTSVPYPVAFHIEVTNMCTLECSGCARTRFIEQWPKYWKNFNLDHEDLNNFLDIDIKSMEFILCGNYGDPIYHPNLHKIINVLKTRGGNIKIVTNGSYKKSKWWLSILKLLDKNDTIVFSIDGIPENFTEYRKNADWKSIELAIKECVKSEVKIIWKYIVFSFNEANIDEARELSKSFGVDEFEIHHSDRFDEKTMHLMPTEKIHIGARHSKQVKFKNQLENDISPNCKNNKNEHFITATGHYVPCCYVADHRFYYKTQFGKNRKEYSIKNNKFTELMQSENTQEFYSNIESTKPIPCQFNCPKIN